MITKNKQKILLFFLFSFSIYCGLLIGESWDERYNLSNGKGTLDYLFSLGRINDEVYYGQYYSSIYWSIQYFISKIFPSQYQIEINHLINLIFSLGTIFGIGKLSKELFNKKVGKITFLILFFYPVFFGHMAINGKDTILAFCHVWIFYLLLRYLKRQKIKDKSSYYIILIGILIALATGIQLIFLGSLIIVFLFILFDIFVGKKIINHNFNKKQFLIDLLKSFCIFYFILILFWIETHQNIFILPFNFLLERLSPETWSGWPYTLVNGEVYFSSEAPKLYFLINLIFKSPEYFLLCYIIFLFIVFKSNIFFKNKFSFFNYKLFLIVFIISLPTLFLFIIPIPVSDGMRLFLWSLPYFCIIPALVIYFLIENFKKVTCKFTLLILLGLVSYYLLNFFSITPYQYTYLNILNGKNNFAYKKFENDYWGTSLKELINKSNFLNKKGKLAICGVNAEVVKSYLNKNKLSKITIVNTNESYDFIIMTNRTIWKDNKISINTKNQKSGITTCFQKFKGKDLSTVKRNNLLLSTIREK